MELQEKIDLYFFDPWVDEKQYAKSYLAVERPPKAYSPLYLMRRQILLLTGKLFDFPESLAGQIPYFSAMLLAHIAVKNLTILSSGKEFVKYNDYLHFYHKYLGLNPLQYVALRLLRNGIEHNNFQLIMRLKGDRAPMYNELTSYFVGNLIIDKKRMALSKYFKITFSVIEGDSEYIVSNPELVKFDDQGRYIIAHFKIQPFMFLDAFEKGIKIIKQNISASPNLQKHFDQSVNIGNWMRVY